MALDPSPRGREMRDGTVRDDFRAANRPDRLTQARAENDRDARRPRASLPEIPRRLHRLGIAWLILDFRFWIFDSDSWLLTSCFPTPATARRLRQPDNSPSS